MDIDPTIFIGFFALVWVGFWIGITTLIGWFSGWHKLQERFPDRQEDPSVSMRFQSARMRSTSMKNCLTIEICPTGLRLKVWKIFGVFSKPIFVPWGMIKSEKGTGRFGGGLKMTFGQDALGSMTVYGRTAEHLLEKSPISY